MHIIYQTTNLINNKIYIGYHHQHSKCQSSYLGSGRSITRAIKKYGKDKFIRKTLFVFDNESDALAKEREIVNEQFLKRTDVYNIALGGGKPPPIIKGSSRDPKIGLKISTALLGVPHTEERKQHMRDNHADVSGTKNPNFGKLGKNSPNFGRLNSDETKKKMIESSNLSQIRIKCPHCDTEGKRSGMQRWHFSNCRSILPNS